MSIYVPKPTDISTKARAGYFYARPATAAAVTVAQIALVAARETGGAISTANMVKKIANSAWNRAHFEYALKGPAQNYTNYGFEGPQYKKGATAFPLLWIPTPTGEEPEQVFGGAPVTVVSPGFSVPTPQDTLKNVPGVSVKTPSSTVATPGLSSSAGGPGEMITWGSGGSGSGSSGSTSTPTQPATVQAGFPWGWAALAAGGGLALLWYLSKDSKKTKR